MSKTELSLPSKQSFQIVSLVATVLVVGIHYRSTVPSSSVYSQLDFNEIAQEFLFGGVARIAVPLFAFLAGLFYFRSDDGTRATYLKKLNQRVRSVGIPYLLAGLIAVAVWCGIRVLEKKFSELTPGNLLSMWILRPPAEQLWFLRDLMVLVAIAPLIRRVVLHQMNRPWWIAVLGGMWLFNLQCFPIVSGWYLLNIETLLFFSIGCLAAQDTNWATRLENASPTLVTRTTILWLALVATRVWLRPNFDIWYVSRHGFLDLILHQGSIVVGGCAVMMLAYRIRNAFLLNVSSASFFVYLVHEFPLRAVIEKISARTLPADTACWIVMPMVVVGCYAVAFQLARFSPQGFAIFTGGRLPTSKLPVQDSVAQPLASSRGLGLPLKQFLTKRSKRFLG
ncbi:Acyltransferase family protein [Neorhodopirellula lusitana]|uniref:Acyltransferase family protein n=1 Tax=Neorhodopirellula lusitana TaxID=445327 RepID=A0ABY1QCH4_9BACT|nr:acyltransferase [Neorhodopirellula lusitana]SMP65322.1 Acyltransferase family protein [Neorhodopirellula lusitana]